MTPVEQMTPAKLKPVAPPKLVALNRRWRPVAPDHVMVYEPTAENVNVANVDAPLKLLAAAPCTVTVALVAVPVMEVT